MLCQSMLFAAERAQDLLFPGLDIRIMCGCFLARPRLLGVRREVKATGCSKNYGLFWMSMKSMS